MMAESYAAAVIISNMLVIAVVLSTLWFARRSYLHEQERIFLRIDQTMEEIKSIHLWRADHEEWAKSKAQMLARCYDDTIRQTAQIAELDRRVTRWENRELDRVEGRKP